MYNRLNLSRYDAVYRLLIALLTVFIVYKTCMLIKDDVPRFRVRYLAEQQDYGSYDLLSKDIGGITFYYPEEGDRTGYDRFPAAPSLDGFALSGRDLRDGFVPLK